MRTRLTVSLLVCCVVAACGDSTTDGRADSALSADSASDADSATDVDSASDAASCAVDVDCDDLDPCTLDDCDVGTGCVNTLEDADMDGFAPAAACATAGLMGGDCNDGDAAVYPGATELCDMIDNDCNEVVDDTTVTVTCLRDRDGDGYGDASMTRMACSCPEGFIPPRPDGETDCADHVVFANPGQTVPSGESYCPTPDVACLATARSWDWNCDGSETPPLTPALESCAVIPGTMTCAEGGFTGDVEACGAPRNYRDCFYVDPGACIIPLAETRPQPCL